MGIVVAVLIMLVILGSVAWVRPSPRDKKIAKWRHEALVAGMKVSLQPLKAEPKESGIRDDIEGASYQLINKQPNKKDALVWTVVKTQGWMQEDLPESWSWYKENGHVDHEAVARLIEECPVEVIAIQRTPVLSRIIWTEPGKEFDPQPLKSFLEKVQDTV